LRLGKRGRGQTMARPIQFDFSTILIPAGVPSAKNNVILKARPLGIIRSENLTTWRYSIGESVDPGITTVIAQLKPMKFRDIMKLIEADGWRVAKQKGSHRQYKHPSKMGKVTIAGHPSAEVARKTLRSILVQAGLTR
jgi:predicted RNA binding protein YcfA (HicA-like mRNA interferase family)